ncbi:uncharacterized protein LOC116110879 [Pistacia vera]|uniref:uncharacterized protein LOC116110879 n=1 Tax=Pistacia vera TaxID=55513 RepID=UPI0012635F5C|nr:uncharacterized protein LOC116110879 [Pistacia vera]
MLSPNLLQPTKSSSSRQMLKEMSVVTEEMKAKAEVYHGDETCREKFMLLLADNGLPVGLLTIHQDIEECGYVKELGFVWLKHKEKSEHRFDNVAVLFDIEVTAYFEQNRIKNLTGVKAKEFLIWISLREIYVNYDSPNGSNITFKTPSGLSKSLPLSVFQLPSQP